MNLCKGNIFFKQISQQVQVGHVDSWWREGSGIGKGPRDGNQTRVAASTVALYVGALTTRRGDFLVSCVSYIATLLTMDTEFC